MNEQTSVAIPDVVDRLNAVLALDPVKPAIEFNDSWLSYGELAGAIKSIRAMLDEIRHRLPGGDQRLRVALLFRNRPAQLAAALAILTGGDTIITINPLLPKEPLQADISTSNMPVLIADAQDCAQDWLAETVAAMGAAIILIGGEDGPLYTEMLAAPALDVGRAFGAVTPGVAVEMLSSGTTGKPKRIPLERAGLTRTLWNGVKYESGDPAQVRLRDSAAVLVMPMVHIGGLWNVLYALYSGRKISLLERFDAKKWHALIVKHRPRFANLPPSALGAVLDQDFAKDDFESLLAIRCGAAPLDPVMAAAFEAKYGVPILEAYGATEFAGGVAGWTLKDHKQFRHLKPRSVGRPNTGVSLRIAEAESADILGPDQPGLLEVQMRQDGQWVRTTDLAKLDEDGFLYILGRADGAINRGGFKIMPEHVQDALRQHPAIREVCVVGLADERLGQVPGAAYELAPGATAPTGDELKEFLRTKLKAYEIPTVFAMIDPLPRTPSMKVVLPEVRAQLLELAKAN